MKAISVRIQHIYEPEKKLFGIRIVGIGRWIICSIGQKWIESENEEDIKELIRYINSYIKDDDKLYLKLKREKSAGLLDIRFLFHDNSKVPDSLKEFCNKSIYPLFPENEWPIMNIKY